MTHLDYLCSMETVQDILEAVTAPQLSAMALCWQGLTQAEIAELLGISHQAVKFRLDRAREQITRTVPEAAIILENRMKRKKGEQE